jgi:hypothetical protein
VPYFSEPVHVELPNKGGEVIMLKILGQNGLSKLSDAFNIERVIGACPRNDMINGLILKCE